jgi:DNA-binding CsgD family transcriptional regulator
MFYIMFLVIKRFKALLLHLGLRRGERMRLFELDEPLHAAVTRLAEEERRLPEEVTSDLLAAGLAQRQRRGYLVQRWDSLSVREQQVAALTCLLYTNRQIAARLGIAEETVKTHVKTALIKFGVHGKGELRKALDGWDFSGWDGGGQGAA